MHWPSDRNLNSPQRQQATPIYLAAIAAVVIAGCGGPDSENNSENNATEKVVVREPAEPVKVLIIDEPAIGPVLARQYAARESGTVQVTDKTWAAVSASNFADIASCDVVIYPAMRMGELATRDLIAPLEEGSRRGDDPRKSVLQFDREQRASWGNQVMGVSLGEPSLVMLCRNDVLTACGARVPETWKDFSDVAAKLAEGKAGDLPAGIGVPLDGHWASFALLARAAPAVRKVGNYSTFFDVGDLEPLIESEPYLRALQGWSRDLVGEMPVEDPAAVLQRFMGGELALAVVPVHARLLEESARPGFEFTLAPLPAAPERDQQLTARTSGSEGRMPRVPLIGTAGLVASASSEAARKRGVQAFLQWLQDKQISAIVAAESSRGGPSHKTHLVDGEKWLGGAFSPEQAAAWANLVEAGHEGRLSLMVLRIPAADRYLDVLDHAVREVIADRANAVESLAAVTGQWNELNEELGPDAQRKAYRASEGMAR